MTQDFRNYNELRAHYLAVRKRLGGLGKSAGLVPIRPPEVQKVVSSRVEEAVEVVFKVDHIPNNNFSKLLIKIAQKHSVDPNSLIVPNHKPEVVKIRREVAYFAVKDLKYSASQIGRWLQRDHKTILYDVKCYERDNAQTA
jgi:chromosomal replication initiation ATPase DnaA